MERVRTMQIPDSRYSGILSIMLALFNWLWGYVHVWFIVGFGWLGFSVATIPSPVVETITDIVILKYAFPLISTLIAYLATMDKVNNNIIIVYRKLSTIFNALINMVGNKNKGKKT